ncbi:MAG: aldo/keto reductase [Eubacteriales bacterium]|nr:aldo/keto reductase [Eubacteriales bacterium]
MNYRKLGKTGMLISEVSLGTWQIGGRWGSDFDDRTADETLNQAIDQGINFFDTADGYGNGLSEKAVARVVKSRSEQVFIATKCGRRLNPHTAAGYNRENIRRFVHESLANMDLETLDLIQLHCPPTEVYAQADVFEALAELKREGKILHYGVSVEKVEEALMAIEYEGLSTVQIIFNMFRQKPAEAFFAAAQAKDVGVIVRVPLASGLLTGKFSRDSVFAKDDHRFYNRNGELFDKGETFAGVNFERGLQAVAELKDLFGETGLLPQLALRWILMFDAVSCVIPGASHFSQITANTGASLLPPLTQEQMHGVRKIYERYIQGYVELLW